MSLYIWGLFVKVGVPTMCTAPYLLWLPCKLPTKCQDYVTYFQTPKVSCKASWLMSGDLTQKSVGQSCAPLNLFWEAIWRQHMERKICQCTWVIAAGTGRTIHATYGCVGWVWVIYPYPRPSSEAGITQVHRSLQVRSAIFSAPELENAGCKGKE